MSVGFGISPYGVSPYGFGPSLALSITSARAMSIRSLWVVLSAEPLNTSAQRPGDALNPGVWLVIALATGRVLAVRRVLRVSATVYNLILLERLDPHPANHFVSATQLLDPTLTPIVAPTSALFDGIAEQAQPSPKQLVGTDLKYQQPGVYEMTGEGDYAISDEITVLKKIILRDLSSLPGAFFHLPVGEFGLGVRVSEPIPSTDLVKLKKEVSRRITSYPEIESAEVSISLSGNGVLIIAFRAKTIQGDGMEGNVEVQTSFVP